MKKRVDSNHAEIVDMFRRVGCDVVSLAAVGKGVPDLLVGVAGRNYLIEVKDGTKPPSAQKLTPEQVTFHRDWRGQKIVISSVADVLTLMKSKN